MAFGKLCGVEWCGPVCHVKCGECGVVGFSRGYVLRRNVSASRSARVLGRGNFGGVVRGRSTIADYNRADGEAGK